MRIRITIIATIALLFLINLSAIPQNSGFFTDSRDGQIYKWVEIGDQIWMAENLRYYARRSEYFDLNLYGRVYDFYTALKVCPLGWHLPSDDEWKTLERTLGMEEELINTESRERNSSDAGLKLKSKSGWRFYIQNGNGTDLYGFNALPGGFYQAYSKTFLWWGTHIIFWTSSETDTENAITRELDSDSDGMDRSANYKVHGCYCRCVKN
jgi:uncharacterized protein (TIGR02145 family)